jgi:hypothetical protein
MTSSFKTISIIVLSYFLFGLFNLIQFSQFVVPVFHHEVVAFALILIVSIQQYTHFNRATILLLLYAFLSLLPHPFLWEMLLPEDLLHPLSESVWLDISKIMAFLSLSSFFVLIAYDKERNVLKLEWLVMTLLSLILLINKSLWFHSFLFAMAGLTSLYAIKRRREEDNYIYNLLIGLSLIYLINWIVLLF